MRIYPGKWAFYTGKKSLTLFSRNNIFTSIYRFCEKYLHDIFEHYFQNSKTAVWHDLMRPLLYSVHSHSELIITSFYKLSI